MFRSTTTVAALSALILAGAAQAAITGTTGNAIQIGPPPSALFGAILGTPASAWNEQQGFITTGIMVDMTVNPSTSAVLTPGIIAGPLDSHILHWNDFSGIAINGTVSFNGQIVGVALTDLNLDNSDIYGAFGTLYPTGTPIRGINSVAAVPPGLISINANTMTFNLNLVPGIADFDQVRVFTRPVPTPGSLALLGAGGLLAGRRRSRR